MAGSVGQPTQAWFGWQAVKSSVGTFSRDQGPNELGMGYGRTANAQNSEAVWPLYLDSVTWKLALVHGKDASYGIATYLWDGNSVGTVDQYNATGLSNVYSEITGISITTPKAADFTSRAATKNASATGYQLITHSFAWIRTGGSFSTPAGTDTPGYTWEWIPWMGYKAATGITLRTQTSGALSGGYVDSSGAGAQNDLISTDAWVDTGTYTVYDQWGYTGSNRGIATISLDGTTIASHDGWSSPDSAAPAIKSTSGIVVATAGVKSVQSKAATKNASSTGWLLSHCSLKLVRTGA